MATDEGTCLQQQLRTLGIVVSWDLARDIVRKTKDCDLAVTAFLMAPRPAWLIAMLDRSGARTWEAA